MSPNCRYCFKTRAHKVLLLPEHTQTRYTVAQPYLLFVSYCTPSEQFGDQILVGGQIFCTCLDWPWEPPSLLYNEYQVSFPRGKGAGTWIWQPTPTHAIVAGRVELYHYSPPVDLHGLFYGELYLSTPSEPHQISDSNDSLITYLLHRAESFFKS